MTWQALRDADATIANVGLGRDVRGLLGHREHLSLFFFLSLFFPLSPSLSLRAWPETIRLSVMYNIPSTSFLIYIIHTTHPIMEGLEHRIVTEKDKGPCPSPPLPHQVLTTPPPYLSLSPSSFPTPPGRLHPRSEENPKPER